MKLKIEVDTDTDKQMVDGYVDGQWIISIYYGKVGHRTMDAAVGEVLEKLSEGRMCPNCGHRSGQCTTALREKP